MAADDRHPHRKPLSPEGTQQRHAVPSLVPRHGGRKAFRQAHGQFGRGDRFPLPDALLQPSQGRPRLSQRRRQRKERRGFHQGPERPVARRPGDRPDARAVERHAVPQYGAKMRKTEFGHGRHLLVEQGAATSGRGESFWPCFDGRRTWRARATLPDRERRRRPPQTLGAAARRSSAHWRCMARKAVSMLESSRFSSL